MGTPNVITMFLDLHNAMWGLPYISKDVSAWTQVFDQYAALMHRTDLVKDFGVTIADEAQKFIKEHRLVVPQQEASRLLTIQSNNWHWRTVILATGKTKANGDRFTVGTGNHKGTWLIFTASKTAEQPLTIEHVSSGELARIVVESDEALMNADWGILDSFTAKIYELGQLRLRKAMETVRLANLFWQAYDIFMTEHAVAGKSEQK